MINIAIALVGVITTFITMKDKIDGLIKSNEEKDRKLDSLHRRLDNHGDDIVKLNTKAELAMTAKDVDEKYVSKELFRQFEKHIDKRFDRIEDGQGKILSFIEKVSSV